MGCVCVWVGWGGVGGLSHLNATNRILIQSPSKLYLKEPSFFLREKKVLMYLNGTAYRFVLSSNVHNKFLLVCQSQCFIHIHEGW